MSNLSLGLRVSALRASQSSRRSVRAGRQRGSLGRGGEGSARSGQEAGAVQLPPQYTRTSIPVHLTGQLGWKGLQTIHVRAH